VAKKTPSTKPVRTLEATGSIAKFTYKPGLPEKETPPVIEVTLRIGGNEENSNALVFFGKDTVNVKMSLMQGQLDM
jgi:hypothetical protein